MKRNRVGLVIAVSCGVTAWLSGCSRGRFEAGSLSPPAAPAPVTTNGSGPNGLIQGSDGNFYGTAQAGGQYGEGVVFRLTPSGSQTVLYSFAGGQKDGAAPQGLIQGSDGNLYGTTLAGGENICTRPPPAGGDGAQSGCGTVFEITLAGTESIIYFFTGGADGGAPNPGLAQTSSGDLYGTASVGGANGDGVVFQLTLTGVETVLHSFAGGTGDGATPASLILGSDGNFYGLTTLGGELNEGTVFSVTPAGVETLLHSFGGGRDGELPSAPLIQGTDGNLYGTTPFGGMNSNAAHECQQGCGTAFRITLAGTETVLYAFAGGNSDGANPYAALVEGSDGNFYGTTSSGGNAGCAEGCGTAFTITPAGVETVLHFFGGTSADGVSPTTGLILAPDGNFYGTTPFGGQFNVGTVFTMTPAGVETVVFSFGSAGGSSTGSSS
jgi:uncharacterized repeat protein (TIGR03803 family)